MSGHDEDNFQSWLRDNHEFLKKYQIKSDVAELIFDAGRISTFNHYIKLISTGEIVVP